MAIVEIASDLYQHRIRRLLYGGSDELLEEIPAIKSMYLVVASQTVSSVVCFRIFVVQGL